VRVGVGVCGGGESVNAWGLQQPRPGAPVDWGEGSLRSALPPGHAHRCSSSRRVCRARAGTCRGCGARVGPGRLCRRACPCASMGVRPRWAVSVRPWRARAGWAGRLSHTQRGPSRQWLHVREDVWWVFRGCVFCFLCVRQGESAPLLKTLLALPSPLHPHPTPPPSPPKGARRAAAAPAVRGGVRPRAARRRRGPAGRRAARGCLLLRCWKALCVCFGRPLLEGSG
jgi:hypothetical protein